MKAFQKWTELAINKFEIHIIHLAAFTIVIIDNAKSVAIWQSLLYGICYKKTIFDFSSSDKPQNVARQPTIAMCVWEKKDNREIWDVRLSFHRKQLEASFFLQKGPSIKLIRFGNFKKKTRLFIFFTFWSEPQNFVFWLMVMNQVGTSFVALICWVQSLNPWGGII